MTAPFDRLQCDGLTVITAQDEGFVEAITSRAFILNLPRPADRPDHNVGSSSSSRYPDAVMVATTVAAVQTAVTFCHRHRIRVSPRTGGHNWFAIWLQGPGSVILDVGGLDQVEALDVDTMTLTAGPGVTSLNHKIPKEWFVPTGHCPQVPLGGFILGGGFGVGFPKYGMACSLVVGMEVVLASGEIRWVHESDTDPQGQALIDLMRGAYHHFPAVITKYQIRAHRAPRCVLPQNFVFGLNDWKLAIKYGRDIAHRGDDDDSSDIETNIVFCHATPEVVQETGLDKVVILSLMAWSDGDETVARSLLSKYTRNIAGLAMPSTPNNPLQAHSVADSFGSLYPRCRYLSEAFFGDAASVLTMQDEEICDMLTPLASMWLSDNVPEEPSHSLVVLMNKNLKQINDCGLATGFIPGIEVMSYAVYQNEEDDEINGKRIQGGMDGVRNAPCCRTALVEGDILNGTDFFARESQETLLQKVRLLDPDGVFQKLIVTTM